MKITAAELAKAERQLGQLRDLFEAAFETVNGKVPATIMERWRKTDRAISSLSSAMESMRWNGILDRWR